MTAYINPPMAESWMDEALCAQTDPDMFFPENGNSARPAKKICEPCPVREQCLEDALRTDIDTGIWGGHTPSELRQLRGPRARRVGGKVIDYDRVAALVAQGMNDWEVSEHVDVSPETVGRWRRDNGIPFNQRRAARSIRTRRSDALA